MTISLRALDVGFDLRLLEMAVVLPEGTDRVEWDGGEAAGSRDELVAALVDAGFVVNITE